MPDINWSQKRRVYFDTDSGEYWVKVELGWMLEDDYREGGRVHLPKEAPDTLQLVGVFTNAQIDNDEHRKEQD